MTDPKLLFGPELTEFGRRFNEAVAEAARTLAAMGERMRSTIRRGEITKSIEVMAGRGDRELGRERLREAAYRRRIANERSQGLAYVDRIARQARRDLGLKELS